MENKFGINNEIVEDWVCDAVTNTAIQLNNVFLRKPMSREEVENIGYDTGFLPEMRDKMLEWIEVLDCLSRIKGKKGANRMST